ncbi:MAG: 3-methyl-2-oxobutanoate hydroxymethyltransferase [Mariprofundaceae bacterium]|nr:3-methyl-2-oxobutanoate hydroxymethyltransferase [Mariprofundaceae bacterium]
MKKISCIQLLENKKQAKKSVWLTAYDARSAQIADQAGVDVLLVGDSLGMVVLGYETTVTVSLDEMIAHASAVVRGKKRALVVCDMPFGTYQVSPEQAYENAVKILQQSGCDAVKIEGGMHMAETIHFLSQRGVPVVGHVGLLPQHIKMIGKYRQHGTTDEEREQVINDAKAVEKSGAVAVVLECVPASIASEMSQALTIPTVGIGSGMACDSQVLVWHDLLGISAKNPPFAKAYMDFSSQAEQAISAWSKDVRCSDEDV